MIRRRIIAGIVLVSLVSSLVHICLAVDRVEAEEALVHAEDVLSSAHVAVVEAEAKGVDVSQFLERLDAAGGLLADAYNAHRIGDFDEAYSYAVECSGEVDGIAAEASALKIVAEETYRSRLLVTAVVSGALLCGLFIFGFLGWRVLRRRHVEKVLRMKPELGED